WISDFTYSYNDPMAKMYFWHPGFDDYPVVGVTWEQAKAFAIWRTQYHNNYLQAAKGGAFVQNYRLPTEYEWEYAARGGRNLTMYPWGGPYTQDSKACFLANFKPRRGNYVDDGFIKPAPVGSFEANDFGLYDMAGNVAEWTNSAYDESAFSFTHDMNPNYEYNAMPDDAAVMKRKVIRGGSWKDISYYLQSGTRTYEYQDSAKSFIGFRLVRSTMGIDE
ncbi:MAG: SUMF1/EgtB/PvdO family nonheme iron enzyme, partial [Bacteroidales bacterium]|nr:SUMF1/EgtB/PvdO family nonheme iron enzyme [Bacteroidales bacterium]